MSNTGFTFKQFRIEQERCAMKVGTDGCLLGAWADIEKKKRILDIGCGSGLISIMAAQRSNAEITGVEIDLEAAIQAKENVTRTKWKERITIINNDINDFMPSVTYDAIISNPPFFADSLKCPEKKRTQARHNDTLPCRDLLQCAKRMLAPRGSLSIIIPADSIYEWCDEAIYKGLFPKRITLVHTLPYKPAKRALIEFTDDATCLVPQKEELTIERTPGIYSDETRELLKDFYLKL